MYGIQNGRFVITECGREENAISRSLSVRKTHSANPRCNTLTPPMLFGGGGGREEGQPLQPEGVDGQPLWL
jgi:hypothetical protein